MLYAPSSVSRPGELWISTWSFQSLGIPLLAHNAIIPSEQNWIAVGMVIYVPFVIPEPAIATKMAWGNGAAVAGNIDVGIYKPDGTRVVSKGSTAQAVVSVIQVVDITDTLLDRGLYYMAMVSDTSGVTQKVIAHTTPLVQSLQCLGVVQQASVTLPLSTGASPATFAKFTAGAFMPLFGVQLYRTIGPG